MLHNGNDLTPPELLIYWIRERDQIRILKEQGFPKPWSEDEVFKKTYFCNVRREDDRVTQFIRRTYSPFVDHPLFLYNIVLARFLNWPPTLEHVGYQEQHMPNTLKEYLEELSTKGKIWGNAYVITTHGQKMSKLDYLCDQVLKDILPMSISNVKITTCEVQANALQRVSGIGSFLAGQIVADLKNTPGHPLEYAPDKKTFVVPGPGSIKGLSYFINGTEKGITLSNFQDFFPICRHYVDQNWSDGMPAIDNQDLQNCLCEFDKYMRVRNGTGRSKRRYNGT